MVRLKWMVMVTKFEHSHKTTDASLFLKDWTICSPCPLIFLSASKFFTRLPVDLIAPCTLDSYKYKNWLERQSLRHSSKERCKWLSKQFIKIKPPNFLPYQVYPRTTEQARLYSFRSFLNLRRLFHSFMCNHSAHPVRGL